VRTGRLNAVPVSDFSYQMNVYYYFRETLLDENAKRMTDVFYKALIQYVQSQNK
jgi:hypothetical protein